MHGVFVAHQEVKYPTGDKRMHISPSGAVRTTLPHLIALKLYSAGTQATQDVAALLQRNEQSGTLDLAAVRDVCQRYMLGPRLERLLEELGLD